MKKRTHAERSYKGTQRFIKIGATNKQSYALLACKAMIFDARIDR